MTRHYRTILLCTIALCGLFLLYSRGISLKQEAGELTEQISTLGDERGDLIEAIAKLRERYQTEYGQ